jgi:hypothetical protein
LFYRPLAFIPESDSVMTVLRPAFRVKEKSAYLNMLVCYFGGNMEFEWPPRSLLFFRKLIWFWWSKVCISGSLLTGTPLPETPDLVP